MLKKLLYPTGFFLFFWLLLGLTLTARATLYPQALEHRIYLPLTVIEYPPQQLVFSGVFTFGSDRDVYVVNEDGSGLINLSYEPENPSDNFYPIWSPTGDKIVFGSYRDGYGKIYLMNSDGSQVTRLINTTHRDDMYSYSWSPDGTQLSFSSDQTGTYEVYTINADSSNMVQRTHFDSAEIGGISTFWSPTGNQIALSVGLSNLEDYWYEVYLMNADGSGLESISVGINPLVIAWSPDGTKILLHAKHMIGETSYYDLFVMSAPSHEVIQVTNFDVGVGAAWSPDSDQIVFYWPGHGTFLINADGTNPTGLYCDAVINGNEFAWTQDGTKLAYHPTFCSWSPSETSCGVYVYDLKQKTCEHIVPMFSADFPSWRP